MLAIDTATDQPGVALWTDGRAFLRAIGWRASFRETLPAADALLADAGLTMGDVGALAVPAGPGSFTGLRVGAAMAVALSRVRGAPLHAVPTLEAVAEIWAPAGAERVCAAIDARRGRWYAALYQRDGDRWRAMGEPVDLEPGDARTFAAGALVVGPLAGAVSPMSGSVAPVAETARAARRRRSRTLPPGISGRAPRSSTRVPRSSHERAPGSMPAHPTLVRPMEAHDLDCVAAIEARSLSQSVAPRSIRRLSGALAGVAWVAALPSSEVAGYAIGWVASDESEVANIAVARGWQRRGIGSRLLDVACREARARGARRIWLEVRESNQPAQALYGRHGFRRRRKAQGVLPPPPRRRSRHGGRSRRARRLTVLTPLRSLYRTDL